MARFLPIAGTHRQMLLNALRIKAGDPKASDARRLFLQQAKEEELDRETDFAGATDAEVESLFRNFEQWSPKRRAFGVAVLERHRDYSSNLALLHHHYVRELAATNEETRAPPSFACSPSASKTRTYFRPLRPTWPTPTADAPPASKTPRIAFSAAASRPRCKP